MRKIIYFIGALAIVSGCEKSEQQSLLTFKNEVISMEAGSTSDVYYSLSAGQNKTVNREDWDIAFSVPLQTAAVRINEGAGVELFCISDTSSWSTINENSINGLSTRLNNKSNWYEGAFNMNAKGFPNYGWGTYHGGIPDHNVGGDSLYVLKLSDGSMIKMMIRAKLGMNSGNIIRWADLDGTNEYVDTISTSPWFEKKHFIHYSFVSRNIIEVEPQMEDWDLLFTRYLIQIPAGPQIMNYMVTGVLLNPAITAAKITETDPESVSADTPYTLSDQADLIGYNWKISDPVTHEVSLVSNTSYLIKANDGKIYLLYFSEYDGLEQGTIHFKVRLLE